VDARYPERWLNDRRINRLTDQAYRLFVCSLAWCVSNRTDGILEAADLLTIPAPNGRKAGDGTDRRRTLARGPS
jgi:hypothetical protein